ncbi:MAG: MFS transporter [Burkholderiales bacterium]
MGSEPRGGAPAAPWLLALIAGCVILVIANGARSSTGLFLPEMTQARGWSRETFGFAMAVQALAWGAGSILFGGLSDRIGATRTLMIGAALYACGLFGMARAETGLGLSLTGGLLMGLGIGGTAFGVVFAAIGKLVPPERRTWAFGIGTAAGSFGQFLFLPAAAEGIHAFGWQAALFGHAVAAGAIALFALGVRGDRAAGAAQPGGLTFAQALREAGADRSFHLLFWGYFVCGLQVVFIGLHLPAYLADKGLPLSLGAQALAIVGLFNVIGSLSAGWLGGRVSKKWLLAGIYVARSIVMIVFLVAPLSAWSVWLFAAAMGLLWLSTVPLTTGLVGQIYGVRHLGLLGGVVFFGHQLGSFLGAWLGGRIFDLTGSYDWAWVMVIAFGAFAAVMHAPIDQRPMAQRQQPAAA